MTAIVVLSPVPLNAHSCRCLAHFSTEAGEKAVENDAHRQKSEKRLEKRTENEPRRDMPAADGKRLMQTER